MERLVRDAARDALVDHVDRAADCLTAVEQDRGAAQDLDALRRQRVDRDGMVCGSVGHVDRADAVDQHLDALAREAAQHGARGTGGKAAGGNAGHAVEHFAQLAVEIGVERRAFDDAGPGEQVELAQASGSDHDGPARIHAAVVEVVLNLLLRHLVIGRRRGRVLGQRRLGHGNRDQGQGGGEGAFALIQHIAPHNGRSTGFKHNPPNVHAARRTTCVSPGYISMSGKWSGRGDSNARPQPWQGCALPLSYARSLALYRTARPGGEARN